MCKISIYYIKNGLTKCCRYVIFVSGADSKEKTKAKLRRKHRTSDTIDDTVQRHKIPVNTVIAGEN